jgi:hypothetical protein
VIGGNLDHDGLDAIGSISAARGVTRQVNQNARAEPICTFINRLAADSLADQTWMICTACYPLRS